MDDESRFAAWSCGHDHRRDTLGRVPTCEPPPRWFILRVLNLDDYAEGRADPAGAIRGLAVGDYTLHVRFHGTYSPAVRAYGLPHDALAYAQAHGWRLKVRGENGWEDFKES